MGFVVLAFFLICGVMFSFGVFPRKSRLTIIYLGLTIGLIQMMWLPSLFAFFVKFTVKAQWMAMAAALLMSVAAFLIGKPRAVRPVLNLRTETEFPQKLLLLMIPLLLLSAYLQYTHTLRPVEGALNVGQSTYGDLCLHLGIATGLRDAAYPPEYTLLPGTTLGYPFLSDAAVTTMLLFGAPLRWAYIVLGVLMMGLVYCGFILFSWEMTHSVKAVVIAYFLMFINGGLGFIYTFDGVFRDASKLWDALYGFYMTPTNMPDLNLRWVNVIADMMVPQRTILAGWTVLIPALSLLAQAIKKNALKDFVVLGVWAGLMPMIHTHSFLALGLIGIGAMVYSLFKNENKKETFFHYAIFGGIALLIALPQLMTWTFPQTRGGNSLRFHFNWVNNDHGLIDGWLWFWVKNVGIVFLLFVPAALSSSKRAKAMATGALFIFLAAELVLFQPNEYDNNKLFYVAFMVMVPLAAQYVADIYERMAGLRWRAFLLGAFILVSTLSGGVTLVRETISDYQLFSAAEADAANYIEENAPQDAVFLTGGQHNNPVAALTGRKLVCGTDTYLYFHGVDYTRQKQAAADMYTNPEDEPALFTAYAVDYIYISSYERASYAINEDFYVDNFPVWYQNKEVTVYAVSERARENA